VTATGSQTAQDGGTDAYKLTEDTANSHHRFYEQIKTDGSAITFSAYFKYIGRQWVRIRLTDSGGTDRFAWFDIQNGVAGTAETGYSGSTITASGNGFYKVSVTLATSVTSGGTHYLVIAGTGADNSTSIFTGSGADSFAVWGIQVSTTGETALNETTSGQIHREYAPTLQTAAINAPRFEFSASDSASEAIGSSRGLLIEGQSTNLLGSSADFGGSWQIINSTKEIAAVGPDGTLSAIAFREGTNSLEKRLLRYYTGGGGSVTISIYAKLLGNARRLVIREANASAQYATFDLATGTVVSGFGSIESVGNGWYRCQLNLSTTGTVQAAGFTLVPADGNYGNREYAGDGYSGLLLAHPQAENQSWASSYIDSGTSGSTATRAADSAAIAVSEITGFSEGVGTVVYETGGVSSATANSQAAFSLYSSTLANNYTMAGVNVGGASDTSVRVYVKTPAGDQSFFSTGTVSVGDSYKLACRYELDNVAASLNGGAVVSDSSGTVPVGVDTLAFGQRDGTNYLNSNLKRIAIYSEALSDTNLQAITS
jgi:hypothetical protein